MLALAPQILLAPPTRRAPRGAAFFPVRPARWGGGRGASPAENGLGDGAHYPRRRTTQADKNKRHPVGKTGVSLSPATAADGIGVAKPVSEQLPQPQNACKPLNTAFGPPAWEQRPLREERSEGASAARGVAPRTSSNAVKNLRQRVSLTRALSLSLFAAHSIIACIPPHS